MAVHAWLYPWFALVVGVICCLLGCIGAGMSRLRGQRLPPPTGILTWLAAAAGAFVFALRSGQAAGVDSVAARGILLGCLGGVVLFIFSGAGGSDPTDRANGFSDSGRLCPGPETVGAATALVAAARLWLTHGEPSGLSALCLATAFTLFILSRACRDEPTPAAKQSLVAALLYVVSLAAAVQLGFARATELKEVFWADVPLLLGAGLSISLVLAAAAVHLGRDRPVLALFPLVGGGALTLFVTSHGAAHNWRPAELALMGAFVFALFRGLQARLQPGLPERDCRDSAASADLYGGLAILLLVAACLVAFGADSGYGLGILTAGGWWALAAPRPLRKESGEGAMRAPIDAGLSGMSFACILLLHRLLVLQSGPGIRLSGPGDTWDLLGIAAGAVIPIMLGAWIEVQRSRSPGWAAGLEWTLTLAGAAMVAGYLWGPRFMAALVLGAALAQFVPAIAGGSRGRLETIAASGIVFGLTLILALPLFQHLESPTRLHRVILVFVCGAILVLRVMIDSVSLVRRGRGPGL